MVLVNSQKMFLSQGQIIEGPKKHAEKRSYLNTYKPGRAFTLWTKQRSTFIYTTLLEFNTTYSNETNRPKLLLISLFLTPTADKKKYLYDIYMTISEILIILLL